MSAGAFVAGIVGIGTVAVIAFAASPDPEVPIDEITPGVVASADIVDVCGRIAGMTYSERHRSRRYYKYEFMRAYGYDVRSSANFQLDHRVPLELGGADIAENLWPQPLVAQMNAQDKDKLENWARRAVCFERSLPLRDAQALFLGDWREAFNRYCQIAGLCNRGGAYLPRGAETK